MKKFPRTDSRVESGLLEEIEGKRGLREKEVPKVRWKGPINTGQDCQEVIIERANGTIPLIAVMHVWRDKLEGGVPFEGDFLFISGAGFVIQDLEINREPPGHQKCHNGVIHCDAVAVALGFEGLLENEVAGGMEGNHDTLVAGVCSDGEAASDVGEELAKWFCDDEHLVGRHCNGRR